MTDKYVIVFDFFGVISDEVSPFWYKDNLKNEDEIAKIRDNINIQADLGEVTFEEFFSALAEIANSTMKEVIDDWNRRINIRETLVKYIGNLNESVFLLSNAPNGFLRPILDKYNLERLFNKIFISCEIHMMKPNKDIFIMLINESGTTPEKIIFIDDNINNINAAKYAGINAILYKSEEQTIKEIEKIRTVPLLD